MVFGVLTSAYGPTLPMVVHIFSLRVDRTADRFCVERAIKV